MIFMQYDLLWKVLKQEPMKDWLIYLIKLFSLFVKDVIKNIIVVFTFSDFSDNLVALETLKNPKLPFSKIMENINEKLF